MNENALLIAGPTASGKSQVALEIARAFGGQIINADSMQVYRDLRILTARPSEADESAVPHALYGVLEGADPCSAGRWGRLAADAASSARKAGRIPIFVGGTGLYFRVLTEGLAAMPSVPDAVRARVRERLAQWGASRAHEELVQVDPASAARIRPSDPQRIARAMEVLEATGRSLADWQAGGDAPVLRPGKWSGLVLAPPRAVLYARCEARLDAMIERGAISELQSLVQLQLDPALPIMKAVGVPPLLQYLAGQLTLEEALKMAKTDTRRYVKRQMTWLRGHMTDPWTWLTSACPDEVTQAAMTWACRSLSGG